MKKAIVVLFLTTLIYTSVGAQLECPFPPAEGSEDIIILRVNHTAATLNGEYIVILNTGKATVELSGWIVFDSYYDWYRNLPEEERKKEEIQDPLAWVHVYRISYGIKLLPHHWVRICSGHGVDNELYLYRNLNEEWLKNDGDTLYLMDEFCNIICTYTWP